MLRARYPDPQAARPRSRAPSRPVASAPSRTCSTDPDYEIANASAAGGFRSILAVPLLREGKAIGGIAVGRPEAGEFPDSQIALVQTFADQAVIAIENVRLFNELDARNRDLTEALEQQTATSDILRVISQSPTDVQPVFDTIAAAALKLCARRQRECLHVRRRADPPRGAREPDRPKAPRRSSRLSRSRPVAAWRPPEPF